MNHGNAGSVF
jgi:hypothetical protein